MTKKELNLRNVFAIAICLAGMTMFSGCEKPNDDPNNPSVPTGAVRLTSPITVNTNLKDLGLDIDYYFDGTILEVKNNATLTIEPGVTIHFFYYESLEINDGGTIKAIGSADKHIKFIGETNDKGSWCGISIRTKMENTLTYVDILNAGQSTHDALSLYNGKADVNNCLIDGCARNGIEIYGDASELRSFSNNTVRNCDRAPVRAGSYASCYALRNMGNNNIFTDNTNEYIHIENNVEASMLGDMTLPSLSAYPWYFAGGLNIPGNRNFTVEAGAVILMGEALKVSETSHFIAIGTPQAHIAIKGFPAEWHDWTGIQVYSLTSGTKLDYCDISNGGGVMTYFGAQALLYYEDRSFLELYNSHLSNSEKAGVQCAFSWTPAENPYFKHANVTFSSIPCKFYILSPSVGNSYCGELPTMSGDWWRFFENMYL